MAKLFLISINLFVVFAIKIFFGGDVSIEQKMQDTIKPGETLNVTLEITKGDREGFAKWQQTLPAGFVASSVEMNGATFSFKNQEIKIIWMELPATETFSIQYKIETSPTVSGEHNLIGKFSFIEENERRDVNSEMFILSIEEAAMADNTTPTSDLNEGNSATTDETIEEEVVDNTEEETEVNDEKQEEAVNSDEITEPIATAIAEVNESNDELVKDNQTVTTLATQNNLVSISRAVKHIENGNYEVTLSISKSHLSSFGKVEDYLPPNYTASAIENNDGIFSFKNNVMKILWMTLPNQEEFEVKYAIQSTSDELDSADIHGIFSYLNVDQSVQTKLAPTKFKNYLATGTTSDQLAEETNNNDTNSPELGSSLVNNSNNDDGNPSSAEEPTNQTNEELTEQITNIPAPETAVAYRVQIAASHKEVNQSYFTSRHGISENVTIEFHETWYKYTIGSFPVYKQARDKRNNVWASDNKINDAFVTAYNAGERISVQEALMISKQKWFK